MSQFLSLIITITLLLSTLSSPINLTLNLLDNDQYPNAVCNDGTSAGYYYSLSSTQSNYWLIHLQGGIHIYQIYHPFDFYILHFSLQVIGVIRLKAVINEIYPRQT